MPPWLWKVSEAQWKPTNPLPERMKSNSTSLPFLGIGGDLSVPSCVRSSVV